MKYTEWVSIIGQREHPLTMSCRGEKTRLFMAHHSGSFVQTLNGLLLTEVLAYQSRVFPSLTMKTRSQPSEGPSSWCGFS
jgi:hypothetical protein